MKAREVVEDFLYGNYEHVLSNDPSYFIRTLSEAGFVIVPKEPTEKMICAGNNQGFTARIKTISADVYRAMLKASEE